MPIRITITNKKTKKGHYLDLFYEEEFSDIDNYTKELNLQCLNFLPLSGGDTYFNKLQAQKIKTEVTLLRQRNLIKSETLNLIEEATDTLLNSNEDLYLIFKGE